jgi:pimeloyl-ACP methyl ester carboxylesterase
MAKLEQVIGDTDDWTVVGSSMGGLMAAVFACQHPEFELNSLDIWVSSRIRSAIGRRGFRQV